MSWGIDLWDQYDLVCGHTEHGIEFVKRTTSFLEKLVHVELGYAKELRKLVKQYKKKEDETSKYSAVHGFTKLVAETNDLAGQRELVAEYWQAEVLEPLRGLAKDIASERKSHMGDGTKRLSELKSSMDQLDRSKKQFEKASEEAENAQHALEKAENDQNSTKAKIDKLTTSLRAKDTAAEESRNNYILQLETTNEKRRQHYNTEMPQVFKNMQDMNAKRVEKYRELLKQCAECHRRVFPVINTCLDNIVKGSSDVDPIKDNQQLIEDSKTGFPIPGDVGFEEYTGKSGRRKVKSKARLEPQPDFSHLPPEQRKKRLTAKVADLDSQISKANADKKAMEKMQNIYAENPKMGDPNSLAQSLEQTGNKIAGLVAERDKFQQWLKDAQENKPSSLQVPDKAAPRSSPKAKKKPAPTQKAPPAPPPPPANVSKADGQESFSEGEDGEDDEEDDEDGREGTVLYDFVPQTEDEVSVAANDKVTIIEDLGDGWLRVRKGQQEGYVPQSYVNIEG